MSFVLLLRFPFFGVVGIAVRSIIPLPSIGSTTESVSEFGIKIREAIQHSDVWVCDDEVDDEDDNNDDD